MEFEAMGKPVRDPDDQIGVHADPNDIIVKI
jgi:hypothetical protein